MNNEHGIRESSVGNGSPRPTTAPSGADDAVVAEPATRPKDARLAEAGRKGGIASGIARRQKRERTWEDAFTDLLDQAPDEVASRLVSAGNSMALVEAIKLATDGKAARLRARGRELEERERHVRSAETAMANLDAWAEEAEEEIDALHEQRDSLRADVRELEQQREALRAAIAAEAEEHGMELVDDAVA